MLPVSATAAKTRSVASEVRMEGLSTEKPKYSIVFPN
jgi:hypothetical protein